MTDNSNDGDDDDENGAMQPPSKPPPPPPPSYLASFGMHLASILASSSSSREGEGGGATTLMARASAAAKSGGGGGSAGPSSPPSWPAKEVGSFRWYWRTGPSRPPAATADSASAERVGRRRRREPEPAFVDVTFTFDAAPSTCLSGGEAIPAPEIRVQFGALIVVSEDDNGNDNAHDDGGGGGNRVGRGRSRRHGWYGRSDPLTMSQLRSHAEEVGFDLDGTDPHVVAGFVADSLADLRGRAGGVCGGRDVDIDGGDGDGGKSFSHLVLGDDGVGTKKTGLVMHHSVLGGAAGTLVEWGGDAPSSSSSSSEGGGLGTGYLGATVLDMVLLSHDDDLAPRGVGVNGEERGKEETTEEEEGRGEEVRSSFLGALEGWYRDAHVSSAAAAATAARSAAAAAKAMAEQAQTQAAAASAAVAAPSSRTGDGGVRDDGGGVDGGGVGARHPAAANALGYNKNDAPPSLLARRKEELEGRGNGDGDGGGVRDVSVPGPDGIKAMGEGGCPKPPPPPPPRPPPSSRQRRSVGAATGRRKKKKKLTIGRM